MPCGKTKCRKYAHRPENVADFLGKEAEEKVTEEDIVRVVLSTEALKKCVYGHRIPCTAE